MAAGSDFEIFLVAVSGLEGPLCAEARAKGFKAKSVPGRGHPQGRPAGGAATYYHIPGFT
jgi:hypothetical protein